MSKQPLIWHLARPGVECAWEEDHQRTALERHGLMDLYMGCDSIDVVCERLTALRAEVASLRALLGERDAALRFARTCVGMWVERGLSRLEMDSLLTHIDLALKGTP